MARKIDRNAGDDFLETPVLLVVFNRPEHTRRVIDAIAKAKPKVLLIAADGPRTASEHALCDETRKVALACVTWECNVLTAFSDENLGCGIRMYTAIDWGFSRFEHLIILEDDCVPAPTFFSFCAQLLDHYCDDERVMHISGNHFHDIADSSKHAGADYYFSKYTHAWGWASWRRAWRHFDWRLQSWPAMRESGMLELWCRDEFERLLWANIFDGVHGGASDIWDYQWNYCCWVNNGLAIMPRTNLVSNIGYGESATHTKHKNRFLDVATDDIFVLRHPVGMVRNVAIEAMTFNENYGGAELRREAARASSVRAKVRALCPRWLVSVWRVVKTNWSQK